jgi:phosphatidate phosphatase PAH1
VDEIINISSSQSNQIKKSSANAAAASANANPIAILPEREGEGDGVEDEAEIGKMNKVLLTDGFEHFLALDLSGFFLSKQTSRQRVVAGAKVSPCVC